MFKPFANRPFIKKFLVSYLFVLLIPIVLNVLTFRISLDFAERYADKSNKALINQVRYSLDQSFHNLEKMVYQLSQENKIDSLSKQTFPLDAGFYFDLNTAYKNIQSYMLLESNIANDYYLVLTNSRTVFDGHTIISFDSFFENRFKYSDWEQQDWVDFLTASYHEGTFLKSGEIFNGIESFEGILFVKTIPFYFNSDNTSFVIFTLKEEELFSYYYPENTSWQGRPILYSNQTFEMLAGEHDPGKENYVNIESASNRFGILYGLEVPYEDVFKELLQVRWLMVLINVLIIILSFGAAFFFSRANANPLFALYNQLKNSVNDVEVGQSGFDLLNGSISRLIDSNQNMQSRLTIQKQVIREEFYFRLVKYGFETPAEMASVSEWVDQALPAGTSGMVLMSLSLDKGEDLRSLKLSLIEILRQISVFPDFWLDLDDQLIGYIYSIEKGSKEEWFRGSRQEVERFNKALSLYIDLPYFWTIGNPVDNMFHLNISYRQGKIVADELLSFENGRFYPYRGFMKDCSMHNLPIDLVQKMFNLARSGEAEMCFTLFEENWRQNMEEFSLSRRHQQIYFLELRSFLTRIEPGFIDHVEFFDFHLQPPDTVFQSVRDIIHQAGKEAVGKKDRQQNELKEQLLSYLEENFDDQNITLSSLATTFGKSESYISHIYKKYCGKNFYALLEGLRMDRARDLLLNTELSIQEVAEKSGYSSMHSFRRVFKKVFGVSPSSFRNVS